MPIGMSTAAEVSSRPTCGREGPAAAAEELVLDRCDCALLHPVDLIGHHCIGVCERAGGGRPDQTKLSSLHNVHKRQQTGA